MPVLAPSLSTGGDRQAYATLVTSDSYVIGALVLAASLREHSPGSAHVPIVVLHAPTLSAEAIEALQTAFDVLVPIAPLHSGAHGRDARNLQLLGRPELDVTYSKLHVWTLTDYDKVVFLDADTLVCDGVEALFGYNELAAAPDCGWPDIFNSGVFVLRPSTETFDQLVAFAAASGSWDGADQGLLNDFFAGSWNRIPFVYNVTPTSVYTYAPAFQRYVPLYAFLLSCSN
ncbi:glycogenin 1, isoform CRA_c [Blastocladiella britannica]|nr:glycogenin 1, isoform CRA_c [Blastocladiella britannica]